MATFAAASKVAFDHATHHVVLAVLQGGDGEGEAPALRRDLASPLEHVLRLLLAAVEVHEDHHHRRLGVRCSLVVEELLGLGTE